MSGQRPAGAARLRPIPLQQLRLQEEGRRWAVDQPIAGLDSLTPVRGSLRAHHLGGFVEVEGSAETIVTLCCDRCLQHYNQPLRVEARELLEVAPAGTAPPPPGPEAEPAIHERLPDDRLDPRGCFDPERWLFEQLSLALPLVNRCGEDCPGPDRWRSDQGGGDPRWAALRSLRAG